VSAAFALVCVVGWVGGILVIRILYARKAARARGVSFAEAAVTTMWLRNEQGGFRWGVVGWLVLWFAIWIAGDRLHL
jgi:hypothetical protein